MRNIGFAVRPYWMISELQLWLPGDLKNETYSRGYFKILCALYSE